MADQGDAGATGGGGDGTGAKKTRVSRSKSTEATIVRAKAVAVALPPLLAGIAEADADAASVRIDQAWVDDFNALISSAEQTADAQPVRAAKRMGATQDERSTGDRLAAALIALRDRIATHHTDDVGLQRAFGRGLQIEGGRTGAVIAAAGAVAQAWTEHRDEAAAAGVTQAQIDGIASLRSALSSADVAQRQASTSRRDGTVDKTAQLALVAERSAYAVRVVGNVFGKASAEARSVADPRAKTGTGVKKATAKAARAATKQAVAQRKKLLAARSAKPAAKAKKKAASKAKPKKAAPKKAAKKRAPAKKKASRAKKR